MTVDKNVFPKTLCKRLIDELSGKPRPLLTLASQYLLLIEQNKDVPICKYKDFLADPKKAIKLMCEALNLPFNEDFLQVFDLNNMSGDSGRSSDIVSKKKRREFDGSFRAELNKSANYKKICEILNYDVVQ